MPFRIRVSLAILLALLGLVLIGPLIVPIPALEDTVPPERLADPDSRFVDVAGLSVHYKEVAPAEPSLGPAFVLLHGFGSSTYSWHEILGPLGETRRAIAFDRPAFGLTERPLRGDWDELNPYGPEGQVAIAIGLMDALGLDRAVLVGHSAGGAIALEIAERYPERVAALVLVDAAVYRGGGAPGWSRFLLATPQLDRIGPLLMRQFAGRPGLDFIRAAWSDPQRIDEATYEAYRKPLRVEGWDRALWELSRASREPRLEGVLPGITQPTLVVTGSDDQVVPPELSERLAEALPNATLVALDGCGHIPQEECPELFHEALQAWLQAQDLFPGG